MCLYWAALKFIAYKCAYNESVSGYLKQHSNLLRFLPQLVAPQIVATPSALLLRYLCEGVLLHLQQLAFKRQAFCLKHYPLCSQQPCQIYL